MHKTASPTPNPLTPIAFITPGLFGLGVWVYCVEFSLTMAHESEKQTRKQRIDTRLKNLGWTIVPYKLGSDTSAFTKHAVEEYPTASGPADYALFVEGRLLG